MAHTLERKNGDYKWKHYRVNEKKSFIMFIKLCEKCVHLVNTNYGIAILEKNQKPVIRLKKGHLSPILKPQFIINEASFLRDAETFGEGEET